ncbi:MAG: cache domain-containing protein [Magnetococcales bacterium]|nr:cache domain-containing protein [Magnetococcales bacterium]
MKYIHKWVVLCVGLVVLTCTGMAFLVTIYTSKTVLSEVKERFRDRATNRMLAVDSFLHYNLTNVQVIAGDPLLCTPEPSTQQIASRLITYRNLFKVYLSLSYFNPDGIGIADTSGLGIGQPVDPGSPPGKHWSQILERTFTHGVGHSSLLNADIITIAQPVQCGDEPHIRGVVVARVNVWRLHSLFPMAPPGQEEKPDPSVQIDLIDGEGILLYSNHDRAGIMQPFASRQAYHPENKYLDRALPWLEKNAVRSGDRYLVFLAQSTGTIDFKGSNWLLQLSIPRDTALEPVYELRRRLIVISLMLTVLAALIIMFFTRRWS